MAARKFKFVSPGVFLKEIDNSQLPKLPGPSGPVIIGRTRKGPALKPVKVESYADFVEIFGDSIPGNQGDDPWRDGNGLLASAYASYAARAHFAADIQSPVTMVRLLGTAGDDAGANGAAGWQSQHAYGLFLFASGSNWGAGATNKKGELAAILHVADDTVQLGLNGVDMSGSVSREITASLGNTTEFAHVVKSAADRSFQLHIKDTADDRQVKIGFSFDKGSKFIRDVLNTNPVMTNNLISYAPSGSMAEKYWLAETFEQSAYQFRSKLATDETLSACLIKLEKDTAIDLTDYEDSMQSAISGWVFSQHVGLPSAFKPDSAATAPPSLFRFHALHEGEDASKTCVVGIEDIRIPREGSSDPYGTFTVTVKKIKGRRLEVVESFPGCNLNPASQNYVARQVGDQYQKWKSSEKRNRFYGNYPNQSRFIRVEMDSNVDGGSVSPNLVPFGFYGPILPINITSSALARAPGARATSSFSDGGFINDSAAQVVNADKTTAESVFMWPAPECTVTASIRGTSHFGISPFCLDKDGNLSDEINLSYGDHLRRLGKGYTSQHSEGVKDSKTKYSFIFSLDEVVLENNSTSYDDLTDLEASPVTNVYWKRGSHAGYGSSAGTPAVALTSSIASVTYNLNGGNIADFRTSVQWKTLRLQDKEGNVATFVFNPNNDDADGSLAMVNGVNYVNIGIQNAADVNAVATKTAAAIQALTVLPGVVLNIGAWTDGAKVKLAQDTGGKAGNTSVVFHPDIISSGKAAVTTNRLGVTSTTGFAGGKDAADEVPAGTAVNAYTQKHSASEMLNAGFDKFHLPLVGGFDGVDITEADPFNNRVLKGATNGSVDSYAFASVERAIELISDPEAVEYNLAIMPGITNESLTTKLVQTCEARADALAIIDLPDVYAPPHEKKCKSFEQRLVTTPEKAAKELVKRQLNSSYGCAYYPWVKIRDTEHTRDVWAPPSLVALGIFAFTEETEEVWFAPAGFNRGGLNEGNAGIPVLQVTEQLLSKQRDTLYEANINPIASFVSEGLVVFGQKTLQSTQSALDRINVRRLLIFIKKEVSRISSSLLFDQNLPATWNRFLGRVVPFLESVKTRLGLSDFKVILDESTTTADLIDRNIMYAKIFLKPARAIEFIAVDFVITRTGASFED